MARTDLRRMKFSSIPQVPCTRRDGCPSLYTPIRLFYWVIKVTAELPRGSLFGSHQQLKVERFITFVTFCYVPWWLTCPLAADAPANDLLLLQRLQEFTAVDDVVAKAASTAFNRHQWYLGQENVPLVFFSDHIDDEERAKLAETMLKYPQPSKLSIMKREGEGFGKPILPQVELDSGPREIASFFGPDSWAFFKLLKLDPAFLKAPPQTWNTNASYIRAQQVVENLAVVNDAAERGVKLASDFLPGVQKESSFQKILQVVENDRNSKPSQRTLKLDPKNWFLSL